jgi:hypothetical protein
MPPVNRLTSSDAKTVGTHHPPNPFYRVKTEVPYIACGVVDYHGAHRMVIFCLALLPSRHFFQNKTLVSGLEQVQFEFFMERIHSAPIIDRQRQPIFSIYGGRNESSSTYGSLNEPVRAALDPHVRR